MILYDEFIYNFLRFKMHQSCIQKIILISINALLEIILSAFFKTK